MATATTAAPASSPLQNIYHLRTVAEPSAKSCMVCFKPSTAVLITPDNKDFFYICRGHLVDRAFASPIVDAEQEAARKRKAELDREVASVVAEYEAKKKPADGKTDSTDKSNKSDKSEKAEKVDKTEAKQDQKPDTAAATDSSSTSTNTLDESSLPRVYALHRSFFQMRVERIRAAERARRNRERLANPATFPTVPSGIP